MQRLAPEIPAIEVEEVEGEQECVAGGARGERLLQRAKIRDPAMLDHGLAVEIRGANGEHRGRLGDRGEPVGPIEAAPGQESHAAVLDAHMQPIAVPLDLVQPAVTRRHFVREARKTGFDELRERVLLCRRGKLSCRESLSSTPL